MCVTIKKFLRREKAALAFCEFPMFRFTFLSLARPEVEITHKYSNDFPPSRESRKALGIPFFSMSGYVSARMYVHYVSQLAFVVPTESHKIHVRRKLEVSRTEKLRR